MSVYNRQPVSAEITNAAFVSKSTDSTTVGKISLARGASGITIDDTQKTILKTLDVIGTTENDTDSKNYSSNNFVSDGDNRKVAIEKLDTALQSVGDSVAIIQTAVIPALDTRVDDLEAGNILGTLNLKHETTVGAPSAGYIKLYPKADGNLYSQNSLGIEKLVGGGASGGGAGANWVSASQDGALVDNENDEKVFLFDLNNSINLFLKVPTGFVNGSQVKLKISAYSLTSSMKHKFNLTSTLVRVGVDAINSTSNQNTNDVELTSINLTHNALVLNVTDSEGKINSIDPLSGDIIKLRLTRVAASTSEDTSLVRILPSTTEIG